MLIPSVKRRGIPPRRTYQGGFLVLLKFLFFFLCFLCIFPASAPAQISEGGTAAVRADSGQAKPSFILNNFYLSSNENMLTARLAVSIDNLRYLNDILRDGARLVLECESRLYRKRTLWADALVAEHIFSSNLQYDHLQRSFIIFSASGAFISKPSLEELLQSTWGNLEMPLAEFSNLEKDETYAAIVSLELKHAEMPPWLTKNVFFWSDTLVPRQEYELEFDY
ncbi:MAG: DUF4390 domain-containing protein [Desulfovibrionaceae bacterium]|nr:DUF4390 domain-containing protein [Desulfovibrionaceae bacterium]